MKEDYPILFKCYIVMSNIFLWRLTVRKPYGRLSSENDLVDEKSELETTEVMVSVKKRKSGVAVAAEATNLEMYIGS